MTLMYYACVDPARDPIAVSPRCDAGEGAVLDLRPGGKLGPTSDEALNLQITVLHVNEDLRRWEALGDAVGPRTREGIRILVNERRPRALRHCRTRPGSDAGRGRHGSALPASAGDVGPPVSC